MKHVNDTVDPHHFRLCCKAEEEVKDWYRKLKERMEPSKETEMTLVRKAYADAVRPVRVTLKDWEDFVRR